MKHHDIGAGCAIALAAGFLSASAPAAIAGQTLDTPRYTLQKVANGYLRLDRIGGQVSFCREHNTGWVCRLAADDRAALLGEIDRLKKAAVKAHGTEAKRNSAAPPAPDSARGSNIQTAFAHLLRRFVTFARNLRRDIEAAI